MKLTSTHKGIMALAMGVLLVTACDDDDTDFSASTTPLLTEGAVATGSADVTATTATLYGSVTGLEGVSSASYSTGFYYGFSQDALTEPLGAGAASSFAATVSGLEVGTTVFYQAYVTLQGRITYRGEVKSVVTTAATATTGDATDVAPFGATLAGSASGCPDGATVGILLSASADREAVRSGLRLEADGTAAFALAKAGLLPATTYYYCAFADLGSTTVYGEVRDFTTGASAFDVDDELVDLGLSVKWARRNVGASTETDLGGLFGFGDLTGVNASIDPADYASADTYRTLADVAFLASGGKATLPTADNFEELFRLSTVEWTEQEGVAGVKVTGPNGNSIFLPAAGRRIASAESGQGQQGYYLTGTVNPSDPRYAVDYEFTAAQDGRASRAVYEALAVRPVSTARAVAFPAQLLYTRWYLDNNVGGKLHVFEGPFTQWGETDTWGTVTNGEPNPYQDIHWEMGTGNGWIGYTPGVDYGYMEFIQGHDGVDTVRIHRLTDDGTATDEEGLVRVDPVNKTIDMGELNVLCANTWVANKSGVRNILSLTEDGLQIGITNGDGYQYSLNYYSQARADRDAAINVSLLAVGPDWGGTWGSVVGSFAPEEIAGTHTVTYEGAVSGAMVTLVDFVGLAARFPDAFVRIDDIKLDGQSIPFDANNFCYGDIEDNGNYRVEMFNIWGKGADGGNVIASPFSALKGAAADPAFAFASTCELTFTVFTDGPCRTYTPNLITINPSWGGTWGFNQGATFDVVLNAATGKYEFTQQAFDILYTTDGTDYSAGSIMTFVEIADIYAYFPTMHATLDALKLDGQAVTYDVSGVIDSNESPKYRLELWNMYGPTSQRGCAFGAPDGGVISGLGFTSTMEVAFTLHSLFAVPQF